MKIRALKAIDAIFGGVAVSILRPPPLHTLDGGVSSVLCIRPGGIGDAVHLIPALQLLKHHFPHVSIDILAERRNAAVFGLTPHVRTVFRYDVLSEFLPVLSRKYDVVIDSEQWHRLSAVIARCIGASLRIGFDSNERRRMFNCPIPYSHDDYELISFLRLLQPLGISCQATVAVPWITISPVLAERASVLLAPLKNTGFAVIFTGASIPERRWGADRFRRVAQLLSDTGVPTVVVGGSEDAAEAEEIVNGLSGIPLAGRTTLQETAAIINRCSVLVSGDSGVLHLGVGLGRPTVSLFGPGIAAKWAPRGDSHRVITKNLPCSPCTRFGTTPRCHIGARCLTDISAEEVFAAALELLAVKDRDS